MKRRMALWLSVLMVLGLLPTTAMATEESDALTEIDLTEEIFGEGTAIEEITLRDLAWTEDGGMTWALPENADGIDLYEIELMYAEAAVEDPAESWETTDGFTVAAAMLAEPQGWAEIAGYSRFVMGEHGGGWYYFRVMPCASARTAEEGTWFYSEGMEIGATAELRLHDNNAYSDRSSTQSVSVGDSIELTDFSRSTQARYFAFASAANLVAWNTEPDGSGEDYNTAEIITVSEDLDLYGRWVDMKIGIGNEYYPADESASGDGWRYDGDDTLVLDGYSGGMIYAPRGMSIIVEGESVINGDIICEEDLHITTPENASLTISGSILSGDFELIANGDVIITTDNFTAVDVRNDVYMTGSSMVEIEAQETAIECNGLTIAGSYMIFCHPQQITPSFAYEGENYIRLEKKASLILSDPDWIGDDGCTPTWSLDSETDPGLIDGYEVRYYFSEDADTIPDTEDWIGWYDYEDGEPVALPRKLLAQYGSGWYRFDVRPYPAHPGMATGQWTEISPAAYFETAAEQLSVSDLGWDGMAFRWTNDFENTDLVDYYEVAIYYGESAASVDTEEYVDIVYYRHDDLPGKLTNFALREYGAGYYAYAVRPISADPMNAMSGDWSALSDLYYFEGPQMIAPQAYDLQWDKGTIAFKGIIPAGEDSAKYFIEVYRRDADGDTLIGNMNSWLYDWMDERTVEFFDRFPEMYEGGTFYVVITTIGDGVIMADSDPVYSEDWTYIRPDKQLVITDPVWNGDMTMNWQCADTDIVDYYEVQFQIVTEGDIFDPDDWDDWMEYDPEEEAWAVEEYTLNHFGSGTYYFRVKAYPADITKAMPSEWSEWSTGFDYTLPDVTLNATDLAWNEETMEMTWSLGDVDPALVGYYNVYIYYSKDAAPTLEDYDRRAGYGVDPEALPFHLPPDRLSQYGPGYYAFSVRATTGDPLQALSGDWSELSPALYFAGPEQKAPQASDLAWNVYREDETYSEEEMGTISFKNPCYDAEERPYTDFWIDIYRKEDTGDVHIGGLWGDTRNVYGHGYPFEEIPEMYESGTYYFTVTTLGDGIIMGDSDPVRSEDWTYTRPDVQLEVADPVWGDGMTMQWTSGSVTPNYYEIRVQYVGEDEEFYPKVWNFSMTASGDEVSALIPASRLSKYGAGRYYFQIRAVIADPTVAVPSEWSAWSAPKHYMTAKLTELGTNSLTVNVCGAAKAELFMAVYDEDGRMIGVSRTAMGQMSVDGDSYSVTFDGDPATVKVFALDAGGTPYGEAMTLEVSLIEGYVLVTDSELSVGSLASSDKALVEVLHLDGTGYEVLSLDTKRVKEGSARVTQYKAPDGTWVTITEDMDNESFIPYGFYGYTMTEDGEIILYDLGTDDRGEAQVLRGTVRNEGQAFTFGDRTDLVTDNGTILHLVTYKSVYTYEGYKNIKLDETSVDALIIYKNRTIKEIYVIE